MDTTTVTISIMGRIDISDSDKIIDEVIKVLQIRNPQIISYNSKDESRLAFGPKEEGFRLPGPSHTEINIAV